MQKTSSEEVKSIKVKYDGLITIATATSRKSSVWKSQKMSYRDFLKKVSTTVRTKETIAEYLKLPRAEQDEIKDVGGFVGGSLKNGKRKADSVINRQLITLDADHIEGDFWDGVTAIFDNACLVYSTHKHQPHKPRLRLIIPLSRPVSPEEYVAVAKKLADYFGIDYFDDTTYQPHRLMYWPSTSNDGEYVFEYQDAPWLNPDEILAQYNDWRDPTEWPESSRQKQNRKRMADKQGNPLEKPGMVGAFCRTYTIPEAIETFLSDVYEEAGTGRYTYKPGTTTGGLVLYDDGLFAYSHHGTDPVSEQLVNAFDLVRIHKYGDLDEDIDEKTPINRTPSFQAMEKFAMGLEKVREVLVDERIKSAQEDFEFEVNEEVLKDVDDSWKKKLSLTKKGDIEITAANLKLILENDPNLKGCFGYNEFERRPEVLKDLPWRKRSRSVAWTNADDEDLRTYLDIVWGIRHSKEKVADVLGGVQRSRIFHPVRDYLNSLKWDGVQRVERLLIDYLGADDTEYTRTVTRMTLVAAVARVMQPGCKYDYMLVLVGKQGIGKSSIFRVLGKQWYSDSLISVQGKEAYEALHGVWIMEMGELAATRKAETEAIKHFLTKQVDRYRVAYGKRPEEFPRQCIFIGTTNESDFLRDRTGNRRFLPVPVNENSPKKWSDLTEEDVDQLWAEAVVMYKRGEPMYLDKRVQDEALKMQVAHTEESAYVGQIVSFLEKPITEDWYSKTIAERRNHMTGYGFNDVVNTSTDELLETNTDSKTPLIYRDKICALEIWCECLGRDRGHFPSYESREINNILNSLPGWKKHSSTLKFGGEYGIQRGYVRVENV